MTERRTNRLVGDGGINRPAFVSVGGGDAPTGLDDYCAWLNSKERRTGRWVIIERDGQRSVDFRTATASDEWLRNRGLAPNIGRAA
jgi:hypothetical protein